ncbi:MULTISPECIES: vWA domain-containing protein [unclassified Halomonas]|uniref:vWA domain-containing protein n=1 Tax=unclassified Halomonas TaxID=2609666 RepID=UPI001C950245|nr:MULTISPECIES: VWA domain-containing protein [unclassified Halomonas]MBY5924437.1 VWA domain-containing protein [Halomonas sp. DP4Y7-2]MBY5929852.1 VWA domain-containing protein [Halomonas sp. DP8Y7-3]MBY6231479.1 VWA domain-containing protein [Halomonas sp. DP4Y7-1]
MMELANPWAFALLPLLWLVRWLPAYRRPLAALRLPFFDQLVDAAGSSKAGEQRRSPLSRLLQLTIWVLIVVALARPEKLSEPIVWQSAARDLILAVDISGSMDERDLIDSEDQPRQRLAAVKDVIRDFVADREGERLALIVFGTRAYVQAPLTEDLDTLTALLDQTEVGMAGPHTALGDAMGLAIRQFEASEVEQRLLVLLSDGADTGSRMSPINAANIAAQREVRVVTIAIGDPDGSGENRVDTDTLKAIADTTDGAFFTAADQQALAAVYQRIDELAPRKVATHSYREHHSLSHWPLALAGLLALLMLTLDRRSRPPATPPQAASARPEEDAA